MDTLLQKLKANLILDHSADDALLEQFLTAAISYAESYQHIPEGTYAEHTMPATTEQAVIMLASISMNQGTAAPVASLRTTRRQHSRCGTR